MQELSLAHLHAPHVTVREQAVVVVGRLRQHRSTTFRALVADSPDTATTVCRFLALLELFREGAVAFDQMAPLGELTIRWTGSDSGEIEVGDEFDAPPPTDGDSADSDSTDQASTDEASVGEAGTDERSTDWDKAGEDGVADDDREPTRPAGEQADIEQVDER